MNSRELRESISEMGALKQAVFDRLEVVGPIFVSRLRDAGETYTSLGKIAGVNRSFLCNVEHGHMRMTGKVFAKLYDRFGGSWID